MRLKSLATLVMVGGAAIAATPMGTPFALPNHQAPAVYLAELHPLNTSVTGLQTTGAARFTVAGDELTITIDVRHAPPGMQHWQHFHGFADNRASTCPTAAADTNQDGIIDLIETEPSAGVTMVPFNADPVAMDIPSNTYPSAAADGSYHYQKTVSLAALQAAFAQAFDGQKLDLDRRVVFIHGVPAATALPAIVQSLGTIPAQVTLPIACGKIERVAQ
jgi:hypothetical protein